MGKPRKLPNGRWGILEDGPCKPDGKRRQIRRQFSSREEALRAIAQISLDRLSAKTIGRGGPSIAVLIEQFFDHEGRNLAATTLRGYMSLAKCHLTDDLIGEILITDLAPADVRSWMTRLDAKPGRQNAVLSAQTKRHCFKFLNRVVNVAIDWELIEMNPLAKVTAPVVRRDADTLRYWIAADVQCFMRYLQGSSASNGRMWRNTWGLAFASALRRGELAGLMWKDIDFEGEVLHVTQTRLAGIPGTAAPKSRHSVRAIPLSVAAVVFLTDLKCQQQADREMFGSAWTDSGFVVVLPTGLPPQPDTFSQRFTRETKRAGVPYLTLHGTRHTHATLALASGSPVHDVTHTTGHHSVSFTLENYGHRLPAGHQDSIEAASQMIFGDIELTPPDEIV